MHDLENADIIKLLKIYQLLTKVEKEKPNTSITKAKNIVYSYIIEQADCIIEDDKNKLNYE